MFHIPLGNQILKRETIKHLKTFKTITVDPMVFYDPQRHTGYTRYIESDVNIELSEHLYTFYPGLTRTWERRESVGVATIMGWHHSVARHRTCEVIGYRLGQDTGQDTGQDSTNPLSFSWPRSRNNL